VDNEVLGLMEKFYEEMTKGFCQLNGKVDKVESEISDVKQTVRGVEEKLGNVENRIGNVEGKLGDVENRLGSLENRVGNVENGLGSLSNRVGNVEDGLGSIAIRAGNIEDGLAYVGNRLGKVEMKIDGEVIEKIRALFDDREIVKEKLDNIQMDVNTLTAKTASHDNKIIELSRKIR